MEQSNLNSRMCYISVREEWRARQLLKLKRKKYNTIFWGTEKELRERYGHIFNALPVSIKLEYLRDYMGIYIEYLMCRNSTKPIAERPYPFKPDEFDIWLICLLFHASVIPFILPHDFNFSNYHSRRMISNIMATRKKVFHL